MWNCVRKCFKICTLRQIQYNANDHVREDDVGRACISRGKEEQCLKGCGGKARMKEPLGRLRSWWEDNIEMHLRDIGWGYMD
jgi:hypothetical protein